MSIETCIAHGSIGKSLQPKHKTPMAVFLAQLEAPVNFSRSRRMVKDLGSRIESGDHGLLLLLALGTTSELYLGAEPRLLVKGRVFGNLHAGILHGDLS